MDNITILEIRGQLLKGGASYSSYTCRVTLHRFVLVERMARHQTR
jgi:hypothetical protein